MNDTIKPGRKPAFDDVALITTSAGLTRDQYAYAKRLGKGNVRAGIRIALGESMARARRRRGKAALA